MFVTLKITPQMAKGPWGICRYALVSGCFWWLYISFKPWGSGLRVYWKPAWSLVCSPLRIDHCFFGRMLWTTSRTGDETLDILVETTSPNCSWPLWMDNILAP